MNPHLILALSAMEQRAEDVARALADGTPGTLFGFGLVSFLLATAGAFLIHKHVRIPR